MIYTLEAIELARPYVDKLFPDRYDLAAIIEVQQIGKLANQAMNLEYISRSNHLVEFSKTDRSGMSANSLRLWIANSARTALTLDFCEALKALNLGKIV